jgi:precorrin-2 methylase
MEKKVEIYAVEECGTEQEKLYYGVNQLPDNPGYMMTIIVKERK